MANATNQTQAAAAASVKYLSSGEFYDQITTGRRTIAALQKFGAVQVAKGSFDWRVPVQLTLNPSVKSRTAWESYTLDESNQVNYLDYEPRVVNGGFAISVLDVAQNMGETQVINLFKAHQTMLKTTLQNKLNIMLFVGDTSAGGSTSVATNLHGFPQLISTSGNVGGLSRATYSALQSTVNGDGGAVSAKQWDVAFSTIAGNVGENPNLIVTTHAVKAKYMDVARGTYNVVKDQRLVDLGWVDGANHLGTPIIDDVDCSAGDTWFINTNYLNWLQMDGFNPQATSTAELPNQDVYYVKLRMFSNMITRMPRSCGFQTNQTT